MTKDEKNYLPQYTLDRLSEYVCLPLEHFDRFDPETMWEKPISKCIEIEIQPQEVTTVIRKAKKTRNWFPRTGVADYHQFLTRVFTLLYYCHRDDVIYQKIVFPKLVKDMGIYGQDGVLKEKICQGIDKLLEEDRLVAAENGKRPVIGEQYHAPEAIQEYPDDDDEVTEVGVLRHKVSFELFMRLLQKAGFDENNTGNKSRAGELWHMVTGLSAEDFRRFCSRHEYLNNHTKGDIALLNEKLKGMGIDIVL